jgi:hypothetical protein
MFESSGERVTAAQNYKWSIRKGGLKMKKIFFVLAIAMLFAVLVAAQSFASEADEYQIIVDELVKEKVVTQEKANEILAEIEALHKKAAKEGKSFELPASLKWLEKFKFSGDFRLRYHMEDWTGTDPVYLARIRARVGFITEVTDGVKVAMGIATTTVKTDSTSLSKGTSFGDPRSTNVTLGGQFQHPAIDLDFAYAQYDPFPWLTLKAGKIRGMPFYIPAPSQFLWDSDINPDGAAVQVNYPLLKAKDEGGFSLNGLLNASYFIVSSWTSNAGPGLWVVQPGAVVKYKDFSSTAAFTYYGFQNEKGKTFAWSAGSNTGAATGLAYHYGSLGVNGEVGLATPLKPFGVDFIHYAGLLGEYIYNPDPPTNNQGFLAGFLLGDKSVSARNSWQVAYMYKYLQRDAFLDTFPDSDFLKGMTNGKGHIVQLQYAPLKNVIVSLTNYYMRPIDNMLTTTKNSGGTTVPGLRPNEDLLFLDLVFKF